MKKIDPGQTIQILANIGVLMGIVLILVELNQAREMMRAQTRTTVSQGAIDLLNQRAANADLYARIQAQDSGGFARMSPADRFRLQNMWAANIRYHQNVFYQYKLGLYDKAEFEAQENAWRSAYAERGLAVTFCFARAELSPDFVDEIEGLLTTTDCEEAARLVERNQSESGAGP